LKLISESPRSARITAEYAEAVSWSWITIVPVSVIGYKRHRHELLLTRSLYARKGINQCVVILGFPSPLKNALTDEANASSIGWSLQSTILRSVHVSTSFVKTILVTTLADRTRARDVSGTMQGMAIRFLLDVRYLGLPRLLAEHVVQTSCQYNFRSHDFVIATAKHLPDLVVLSGLQ
jgi:hypothetical protein